MLMSPSALFTSSRLPDSSAVRKSGAKDSKMARPAASSAGGTWMLMVVPGSTACSWICSTPSVGGMPAASSRARWAAISRARTRIRSVVSRTSL